MLYVDDLEMFLNYELAKFVIYTLLAIHGFKQVLENVCKFINEWLNAHFWNPVNIRISTVY